MELVMADWRELKRHPLSAEYEDITGTAWNHFIVGMKKNGFRPESKIMLHEGMVLDGWQRLRACVATNTEPEFETLPDGDDAEDFVIMANDMRRKEETAEVVHRRVEARRVRVAERRTKGESIRTIADAEKVSPTTIGRDLEEKPPTVPPVTVDGKDGKKHAASKGPAVICRHCEHRKNMGRPLIENCEDCAELRKVIKPKRAKKEPPPEPTTTEEAIKDDAGTVVPARLVPVFRTIDDFAAAEKLLNATSKAFKAIEEGAAKNLKPLDEKGHFRKFYPTFKSARLRLKAMRPSLVCSKCEGDGCGSCQNGVITKERADAK